MSEKTFAITVTILYALLILCSLGDPLMLLSIGRLLLGESAELFFSIIPYGIVSLLLAYLVLVKRETRVGNLIFLMIMSVAIFFVVRFLSGEREKIHLVEFAVLGGLILHSARVFKIGRNAAYGLMLAAGLAIVGCDELLQAYLSIKVLGVHDVLINSMAVVLGAVTYAGLFYNPPYNNQEPETLS